MLSYGDNENDNLDVFFAKNTQCLTSSNDIQVAIKANDYDDFIKLIDRT